MTCANGIEIAPSGDKKDVCKLAMEASMGNVEKARRWLTYRVGFKLV